MDGFVRWTQDIWRAYRRGVLHPSLQYAPSALSGVTIATLVSCLAFWRHRTGGIIQVGDESAKLSLPFISLTGYQFPERAVYVVGHGVSGLAFIVMAQMFSEMGPLYITPVRFRHHIRAVGYFGIGAGLGLIGQALVPLQANIAAAIASGDMTLMQPQSFVHQGCAALFFAAAVAHSYVMLHMFYRCSFFATYPTKLSMATIITLALPGAMVFHPASGWSIPMDTVLFLGASCQWICVLSLLGFFASYAVDIRYFLETYERPTLV